MIRKGQHLFNEIAKRHQLTSWQVGIREMGNEKSFKVIPTEFLYVELHSILFNMTGLQIYRDKMIDTQQIINEVYADHVKKAEQIYYKIQQRVNELKKAKK